MHPCLYVSIRQYNMQGICSQLKTTYKCIAALARIYTVSQYVTTTVSDYCKNIVVRCCIEQKATLHKYMYAFIHTCILYAHIYRDKCMHVLFYFQSIFYVDLLQTTSPSVVIFTQVPVSSLVKKEGPLLIYPHFVQIHEFLLVHWSLSMSPRVSSACWHIVQPAVLLPDNVIALLRGVKALNRARFPRIYVIHTALLRLYYATPLMVWICK